jgi:hypothetical protein
LVLEFGSDFGDAGGAEAPEDAHHFEFAGREVHGGVAEGDYCLSSSLWAPFGFVNWFFRRWAALALHVLRFRNTFRAVYWAGITLERNLAASEAGLLLARNP